jgi:hypothetical protein
MVDVVGGNDIESESERSRSLYVRADNSDKSCEERDGCIVLDYAFIFKERD